MPRALWPLVDDRPSFQVILTYSQTRQRQGRMLLADTGAGSALSQFDLILSETDCLMAGGMKIQDIVLGGAYSGPFPR